MTDGRATQQIFNIGDDIMKKVQDVLTLAQIRLIDGLATALGPTTVTSVFLPSNTNTVFPTHD